MGIFHTGNYVRSHYNFRIFGLDETNDFGAVASTLFNIHFRGSPSRPSTYLQNKLKAIGVVYDGKNTSVHLDTSYMSFWKYTILGQNHEHNPALSFFEETLPDLLGPFSFLHSLFRPEVSIADIVQTEDGMNFAEERVDFFLPVANLVIEIDGSQHNQNVSRQIDQHRNHFLRKNGVTTFRVTTLELARDPHLHQLANRLQRYLASSSLVAAYKKLTFKTHAAHLTYTTMYRLQAILIEMLGRNMLSLGDHEWALRIHSEIEPDYIEIAINDLFNWVSLIDSKQSTPNVIINSENPTYDIDISISRRWDDTPTEARTIECRTDHFDYFPDGPPRGSTDKDYFDANHASGTSRLDPLNVNLNQLLYQIFGYSEFNSGQIDIIENVLLKSDTIGILPTGGGKSLCYQLPAILESGVSLVVCPIKSLMRDQVAELKEIGFHRSACIDSDTSIFEKNRILEKVKRRQIRFLFISPERLQISGFRDAILQLNMQKLVNLVVVDEVHCMSEWGHDFRTSYLTLPTTLDTVTKDVPRLCLTATASNRVLKDIQKEFSISDDNVKTLSKYERNNLNFKVVACSPVAATHKEIKLRVERNTINKSRAAIVFTPTVNGQSGAYSLFLSLGSIVKDISFFTGSKPKKFDSVNFEHEKATTQKSFKENQLSTLVATKAFGMGVNKKNVYTTIHAGLPQSIESLYQEAGRAGRDKKSADCIVFFQPPSKDARDNFFEYGNFERFLKLDLRKMNGGDLSIHHFFIKLSIADNFSVPGVVGKLLENLLRSDSGKSEVVAAELGSNKMVTELALYRLYQIGVITDWTVEDFVRGIFLIDYRILTVSEHNSVVREITGGEGIDPDVAIRADSDANWLQCMGRLIQILVDHHLNTRVHSRIESLKTLLMACDSYNESAPHRFREVLESYFTIDHLNDSISDIIDSHGEPSRIISYLNGTESTGPILQQPHDNLTRRLFPLRRYIESYPANPSLALLNELVLFHLDYDRPIENLRKSLEQYKQEMGFDSYLKLVFGLKILCANDRWPIIRDILHTNESGLSNLDRLAQTLDSDIATEALLSVLVTDMKKYVEKLNELV